jgi:hypothetical protein
MPWQAKAMSIANLTPYPRVWLAKYSERIPGYDIMKGTLNKMDAVEMHRLQL